MREIWSTAKGEMQKKITPHSFRMWIESLELIREENNTLFLSCPNQFFKDWVIKNYGKMIQDEICKMGGATISYSLEITERKKTKQYPQVLSLPSETQRQQTDYPPIIRTGQMTLPNVPNPYAGVMLRNGFTFDQFVVGNSNKLAYSAAYSLAAESGYRQNNLFLVSKTGLGKSHLSQAIGHHIINIKPANRVYYVTAENFANEMISSIQNKGITQFKEKYRRMCDVLILEDVHFLSGKDHTQDELAFTLDALMETNKRIIFTSCYNPNEIPKIHDNLISRLCSGLITPMEQPDYKTRYKILEKKALSQQYSIPEEVIHYLASELTMNVRQLESGLFGLMARASLLNMPLNLKLAEMVTMDLKHHQQNITIETIKKMVCTYFKVSLENLISSSRKKNVVNPRQIAMYLCRRYTEEPLQAIGKSFNKHHATAFHSVTSVEKKVKQNGAFQKQLDFLCQQLENGKFE